MGAHRSRSTAEQMAEKADTLLAHLDACARHGRICPGLNALAALLRMRSSTVYDLFNQLRASKAISWTIAPGPHGKARVVTISSTGMTTARPKWARRSQVLATPTFTGPPVRVLEGREFEKRKRELEARDRGERA